MSRIPPGNRGDKVSYYFIYTVYRNGRVKIRDRPYPTYRGAQCALKRILRKLSRDPDVKAVRIGEQLGIDLADINLKKII